MQQITNTFVKLLKGLVPNLINVSHGTIQFVLYNELKLQLGKKHLVSKSKNRKFETL